MGKYYCLIAGLPDITLEDTKSTYSVTDFKTEIEPLMTGEDKRYLRWFFLKYDNSNLLSYLRKGSVSGFDGRGVFSVDEIKEICELVKIDKKIPRPMYVPAYIPGFIKKYFSRLVEEDEEKDEDETPANNNMLWEDRLSSSYFNEAMKCGNQFLASWFELNLNIGNVLAARNCREYGLDREDFIIGDNELAVNLRRSSTRDFDVEDLPEHLAELFQIAEEKDLFMRERRLDVLRWNWLEDNIACKTFDFVSVMAYLLRLEMIERWLGLGKERGEKAFRSLITDMKRGSAEALENFKENNK